MIPVPSGLVRISASPGRAPALASIARIDLAGDGVAELDLLVLHGVAAEQRHAGLAAAVEPAGERSAPSTSRSASLGKPAIASAVSGRPPIA